MNVLKVPCVSHKMHSAVQTAFNNSNLLLEVINDMKLIVKYFKQSTTAKCLLDELRKDADEPVLSLIQSVCTRWNSEFNMMERFMELKTALSAAITAKVNCPPMICNSKLKQIPEVLKLLRTMNQLSTEVGAEKAVTSSIVIPGVNAMEKGWDSRKLMYPMAIQFRSNLKAACKKYLHPLEKIPTLRMATLLDPRFKRGVFRDPLNELEGRSAIQKELNEIKRAQPSTSAPEGTVDSSKRDKLWGFLDECAPVTKNIPVGDLFNDYLNKPRLLREKNPWEWWDSNKANHPEIYQMSRKYLLMPASSVASERAASRLKNLVGDKKTRIGDNYLSQRLFLSTAKFNLVMETEASTPDTIDIINIDEDEDEYEFDVDDQ